MGTKLHCFATHLMVWTTCPKVLRKGIPEPNFEGEVESATSWSQIRYTHPHASDVTRGSEGTPGDTSRGDTRIKEKKCGWI